MQKHYFQMIIIIIFKSVRDSVGAKIFGRTVCNECVLCSVFAVTEPTPGEK